MYTLEHVKKLEEVVQREDEFLKKHKDGIIQRIKQEKYAYLKQAHDDYLTKAYLFDQKLIARIKNKTISRSNMDFIADRLADVVVIGLSRIIKEVKQPDEEAISKKASLLAKYICMLDVNLDYLDKMLDKMP